MLITYKGDGKIHVQEGRSHIVLPVSELKLDIVRAERLIIRNAKVVIKDLQADYLAVSGSCHVTVLQSGRYMRIDTDESHFDSVLRINGELHVLRPGGK